MSEQSSPPAASLRLPDRLPENYTPTPEGGLTDAEAQRRLQAGLGNKATADAGKGVLQIVSDNLFTLFNFLNLGLAVALALVGSWKNMTFMVVVISNVLIATVQEFRARRVVQRLTLMSESPVRVIRDWITVDLPQAQCVQGDLIRLRAGDQIPADAILVEGACAAGEALLTGEQDAVPKHEGDWLYSGSYINSGSCVAQLVNVGDASYINRLSRNAKTIVQPKSQLMTDLKKLIRFVSVALVPIGLMLFLKQVLLQHREIVDAVPPTVAAMIGMIPEGLMLLTSIALMVGVVKLAKQRTLVQSLYGIETLARVDTLCLDKTGTLTTGRMGLEELIPWQRSEDELKSGLSRFLGSADLESPTMAALARAVNPVHERASAQIPFSSRLKYSAFSYEDGTTLAMGAPSFLLGQDLPPALAEAAEDRAEKGMRVLALAAFDGTISDEKLPPLKQVLGLVVLSDELRPNVASTLDYFRREGVTVKVISGDDPRTVATIAEKAGVASARDHAVDVSLLTDEEVEAAANTAIVFGRVTPARKQQLVEAMQRAGHTVGMTGDGVNDIPAMKTADCSIAMAAGSDATRHAAEMILLDSDFTCLPKVVSEGRRVINNITRSASLFLVKTLYSFALSLLTLVLPVVYPFEPLQLSLISALTVGIPSFVLTLEPNTNRVKESFLRGVLRRAIPCAAGVTLCAVSAALMGKQWGTEISRTIATYSGGLMGIYMLVIVCMPLNLLRGVLVAAMAGSFVAIVSVFGDFFKLVPLSAPMVLSTCGLMAAGITLAALLRLYFAVCYADEGKAAGMAEPRKDR